MPSADYDETLQLMFEQTNWKGKKLSTFLDRITSRKFIIAGFAVAALVLNAVGVIEQPIEVAVAETAGLSVYLFVQGLIDLVSRRV